MRNTKVLMLVCVVLCVAVQSGCNNSVMGTQPIPAGKAVIYVFPVTTGGTIVKCDGKSAGYAEENYMLGHYVAIAVDPGPHEISCWGGESPLKIDAVAGKVYYVELQRQSVFSGKWTLKMTDNIQGEYSVNKRIGRPL